MDGAERTLDLTVTGTDEERSDRWASTCNELGLTVYGHTKEEARQALHSALTVLLSSFDNDSLLRDYLDRKGVKHRFIVRNDHPHLQGWHQQFEVSLGAEAQ